MIHGALVGVLPVLQTPFLENGAIDQDVLVREIEWALEVGADGVCSAMVSELLRLSSTQRVELTHLMANTVGGRGAVIASVGAETTTQAIAFGQEAEQAGCDAIMAIPPISTALPDEALCEYFGTLADNVELPLIIQDASSHVGRTLSIPLMIRLLDQYGPNKILFKPEGNPIGPNLSMLRDASGARARVFDGSGGILLIDAYRRGIVGTMPGVDLLDGIVALWKALQRGDDETAYRVYFPIAAIIALQLQAGLDGFLAIEKYLLVRRGIFPSDRRCRPNAWELDAETAAEVDRLFDRMMDAIAC